MGGMDRKDSSLAKEGERRILTTDFKIPLLINHKKDSVSSFLKASKAIPSHLAVVMEERGV